MYVCAFLVPYPLGQELQTIVTRVLGTRLSPLKEWTVRLSTETTLLFQVGWP